MSPTVYIALRAARANRVRHLLLAIVIALGLTTFLVMNELARASTAGLEAALADDVGAYGTFAVGITDPRIAVEPDLPVRIASAIGPFALEPPIWVRSFSDTRSTCPPFEDGGVSQVIFVTQVSGRQVPLAFGGTSTGRTRYCIDGQPVPGSAIYQMTEREQREWGAGLVLDVRYFHLAWISTVTPVESRFVFQVRDPDTGQDAIASAVRGELAADALTLGVDPRSLYYVQRLDTSDGTYRAAQGVRVVYGVIGAAVILLAAAALLVAQLLTERSRAWFFALGVALGASPRRTASLVLADAFLAVATGTALAIGLLVAGNPIARQFARSTFEIDIDLLTPRNMALVAAAAAAITVIGGAVPAIRASRRDPLDTLEPAA